jgi:uncharacterized protein with HEPN domain
MPRASDLYLHDIMRAISRIETLTTELEESTFTADNLQVDGVLFNLMTIGEAVKNIPDEVRDQYPEIRWRDIGRFRDRVVHHYFALDMAIVWEIVSMHLPLLKRAVETLLEQAAQEDDPDSQSS